MRRDPLLAGTNPLRGKLGIFEQPFDAPGDVIAKPAIRTDLIVGGTRMVDDAPARPDRLAEPDRDTGKNHCIALVELFQQPLRRPGPDAMPQVLRAGSRRRQYAESEMRSSLGQLVKRRP